MPDFLGRGRMGVSAEALARQEEERRRNPGGWLGNLLGDMPSVAQQMQEQNELAQRLAREGGPRAMLASPELAQRTADVAANVDLTGSLDLSTAARMARAKAMGFDVDQPVYHATSRQFDAFDPDKAGSANTVGAGERAVFLTDKPGIAESYLPQGFVWEYAPGWDKARYMDVERQWHEASRAVPGVLNKEILDRIGGWKNVETARKAAAEQQKLLEAQLMSARKPVKAYGEGANMIPLYAKSGNIKQIDMKGGQYNPDFVERELRKAKKAKKDGVAFNNMYDWGGAPGVPARPGTTVAIFDPANVRSVHAKFDPAKRRSADLLAGVVPPALIAGGLLGEEQRQ